MNNLHQFSAAAGILSRMMTTVDAFRVCVEWTDQWPRDQYGNIIPNARISPPPIGIPSPVGASTRPQSNPASQGSPPPQASNPASPYKQGVAMTNAAIEF